MAKRTVTDLGNYLREQRPDLFANIPPQVLGRRMKERLPEKLAGVEDVPDPTTTPSRAMLGGTAPKPQPQQAAILSPDAIPTPEEIDRKTRETAQGFVQGIKLATQLGAPPPVPQPRVQLQESRAGQVAEAAGVAGDIGRSLFTPAGIAQSFAEGERQLQRGVRNLARGPRQLGETLPSADASGERIGPPEPFMSDGRAKAATDVVQGLGGMSSVVAAPGIVGGGAVALAKGGAKGAGKFAATVGAGFAADPVVRGGTEKAAEAMGATKDEAVLAGEIASFGVEPAAVLGGLRAAVKGKRPKMAENDRKRPNLSLTTEPRVRTAPDIEAKRADFEERVRDIREDLAPARTKEERRAKLEKGLGKPEPIPSDPLPANLEPLAREMGLDPEKVGREERGVLAEMFREQEAAKVAESERPRREFEAKQEAADRRARNEKARAMVSEVEQRKREKKVAAARAATPGDAVSFGDELGEVVRVNERTVTIQDASGQTRRIPFEAIDEVAKPRPKLGEQPAKPTLQSKGAEPAKPSILAGAGQSAPADAGAPRLGFDKPLEGPAPSAPVRLADGKGAKPTAIAQPPAAPPLFGAPAVADVPRPVDTARGRGVAAPPAPPAPPANAELSTVPDAARVREASAPAARPTAAPAVAPVGVSGSAGRTSRAKTESYAVDTRLEIIEGDDLIASSLDDLSRNPAYDHDLQPRSTDSKDTERRIGNILSKLDPERLGDSLEAQVGGPIVGIGDNMVESGNARVLALRRAYARGSEGAKRYRQYLIDNAEALGLDPAAVRAAKAPILARRRLTDMTREQRLDFVREANENLTNQMSAAESAKLDSERLTPKLLGKLRADKGLDHSENADFVREFLESVPSTEVGSLIVQGKLSGQGSARIEAAILAKAYGDTPTVRNIINESGEDFRNLSKAMQEAAPAFASLQNKVEAGERFDVGIADELADAAATMERLRRQGMTVDQYVNDQGRLGLSVAPTEPALSDRVLLAIDTHKRAPKRIAGILERYAELVDLAGDPRQGSMFGQAEPPNRSELWDTARRREETAWVNKEIETLENKITAAVQKAGVESEGALLGKHGDPLRPAERAKLARFQAFLADLESGKPIDEATRKFEDAQQDARNPLFAEDGAEAGAGSPGDGPVPDAKARGEVPAQAPATPEAVGKPKPKPKRITADETEATPEAFSASQYQLTHDASPPHIAEISPVQRGRMSKRQQAQYDAGQTAKFDKADKAREDYVARLYDRWQSGEFDLRDDGVSADARSAVFSEVTRRREAFRKEEYKRLSASNEINSVADVEVGDVLFDVMRRSSVRVTRKSAQSVRVAPVGEIGAERTVKTLRQLHRQTHDQIAKAAEEAAEVAFPNPFKERPRPTPAKTQGHPGKKATGAPGTPAKTQGVETYEPPPDVRQAMVILAHKVPRAKVEYRSPASPQLGVPAKPPKYLLTVEGVTRKSFDTFQEAADAADALNHRLYKTGAETLKTDTGQATIRRSADGVEVQIGMMRQKLEPGEIPAGADGAEIARLARQKHAGQMLGAFFDDPERGAVQIVRRGQERAAVLAPGAPNVRPTLSQNLKQRGREVAAALKAAGAKVDTQKARTQLIDRTAPIQDFLTAARKKGISAEDDAGILARTFAGVYGAAENKLDFLDDILAPVRADYQDLVEFAMFDRFDELAKRGVTEFPDGMTRLEVLAHRRAIEQRLRANPERWQRIQTAAQNLRSYQGRVLSQLRDEGIISDQSYQQIRASNQHYIPLQRVGFLADDMARGATPRRFSVATQDVVKELTGSQRDIIDPLESIVRNTYKTEHLIGRNRVARAMAELRHNPDYAGLVIPLKRHQDAPTGMEKLAYFEGGQVKHFAVPKAVGDAMKNIGQHQADLITKAASIGSGALRAGATGLNVAFIPSNALRDFQTLGVTQGMGVIETAATWAHGLAEVVGKGRYFREWKDSGGSFSGYFENLGGPQRTAAHLRRGKVERVLRTAANPFELIRHASEIIEQAPRVGAFKRARVKLGESATAAAFTSRNATVDFARSGSALGLVNMWVPFLNARLQGNLNIFKAFRDHPARTLMASGSLIIAPALATYFWNKSQFPEVEDDIQPWERETYFHLILGDEKDENGRYTQVIKIPKGEVGRVMGNSLEAFLDYIAGRDGATWQQLGLQIMSDVAPISFERDGKFSGLRLLSDLLPPTMKAFTEVQTNRSFFTGRDIVPRNLQDASPSEQYKNDTPPAAVAVGQLLDVSPLKVQAFVRSQFGGLGEQIMNLAGGSESGAARTVSRRFSGAAGGYGEERAFRDLDKMKAETEDLRVRAERDALRLIAGAKAKPQAERWGYVRGELAAMAQGNRAHAALVLDELRYEAVKDQLSPFERALKASPVAVRAELIAKQARELQPQERGEFVRRLQAAHILTDSVLDEMTQTAQQAQRQAGMTP